MNKFEKKITNDKIKNYFIHSSVLIDVDGASLNNWGRDETNRRDRENATAVKKVFKNGRWHAVIAGQAWRYWWRETLGLNGWSLSPITRDKKIAFTEADPINYPDDDVFGYMRASREEVKDESGNVVLQGGKGKNKDKPKMEDVSVTRISPLKNSILTSVVPIKILNEFSTMARQQDGDAVIYEKQSYSTVLKGMFSVDLDQIGTFTKTNRAGYKNITDSKYSEIIDNNGFEVDDLINPHIKRARLTNAIRLQRVQDSIKALKTIAGGAKRSTNYASVKPDFIILAVLKGGNNIFDNIAVEENGKATLSLDALKEAIEDNKEYLRSDIYIGKAAGFMDEVIIKNIEDKNGISIKVASINKTLDEFNSILNTVII